MKARLALWWRALTQRSRFERELDDELAFHRDARCDDLVAQGVAPREALRQATLELGMTQLHRDACRRARGIAWLDTVGRDLRYAFRALSRNRGYSLTAILVLGAAVAANVILFGLFNAYALQSPPMERAERWVMLESTTPQQRILDRWTVADADALLRDPLPMVEGLYWLRDIRLPVVADVARPVSGEAVSDNYFSLLGIRTARGRTFLGHGSADDDGGVVLSDLGWQRLANGDHDVVGRSIELAGQPFTVLGVTAPEFSGTTVSTALFWILDRDLERLRPDEFDASARVDVGGFLREGASAAEAAAALTTRVLALNADKPEDERLESGRVTERSGYLRSGDLDELAYIATPIGLAFALLLVVASANLANLVLARFSARRRELAVRAAVGASRLRMAMQLLTECAVLAGVASVFGFVLASVSINPFHDAMFSLLADFGVEFRAVEVDLRVFAYGLGLALLAAVSFGALPAFVATAPWRRGASVQPAAASLQRAGQSRMRGVLMVAQLAASVVLLVLATLIASNARLAEQLALGFDPGRVIGLQVSTPTPALVSALQELPQVEAVSAVSRMPLMGMPQRVDARIGASSQSLGVRVVDAAYFSVLDIDLQRGRGFVRQEGDGAMVAVLSRRTAERLWPGQDALGRTFELPPQERLGALQAGRYEVVGVVDDVVSGLFIDGVDPSAVYLPGAIGASAIGSLVVRVRESSPATLDAVTRACIAAMPAQDCEPMPMRNVLRLQHMPFLVAANVSAALGWTALAISCVGLYGLTSYLVQQRRREIGVRLALGATSRRVMRAMLGQIGRLVAMGIAIGLAVALLGARLFLALIENLRVSDPVAFLVVPLLLAALALVAAWVPTRRIARIPPTDALRDD
ncbi:ABC transporter permease [Chiayiivirga flava]|uniref:Putative permease n=1 Tax=Chiayiivirga flava TaxID=659595 RepID=A0A7W8G0B2_9GAMM|nr:ABC transporter permease [Chiayiivirga flava]MBB5209001.1 putative permease [Chiayiivirga flava]